MFTASYPPVQATYGLKTSGQFVSPIVSGYSLPLSYRPPLNPPPYSQKDQADLAQMALKKRVIAQGFAEQFCEATLDQFSTDEKKVQNLLKEAHRLNIMPEFNAAVGEAAHRRDEIFQGIGDVLKDEFAPNRFEKWFKNASLKECNDYLKVGKNLYRPTPWDYRLNGMYRSITDFLGVCRQHPIMSGGLIASMAYLGGKYPFLGGVSGLAIAAWASVFMIINEIKAHQYPGKNMDADKASYYRASGENLCAILMTASGAHGIDEGTRLGLKVFQKAAPGKNRFQRIWKAVATDKDSPASKKLLKEIYPKRGKNQNRLVALCHRFLFVAGLFDNVLLPFNGLADVLHQNNQSTFAPKPKEH